MDSGRLLATAGFLSNAGSSDGINVIYPYETLAWDSSNPYKLADTFVIRESRIASLRHMDDLDAAHFTADHT